MGAWSFVAPRFENLLGIKVTIVVSTKAILHNRIIGLPVACSKW